jgi:hypothetical protein
MDGSIGCRGANFFLIATVEPVGYRIVVEHFRRGILFGRGFIKKTCF